MTKKMTETYAIGDLHGHFDQFLLLYDQLLNDGLDPEKDTLIFLGDIVDGGPQTKQVIDWLMDYEKKYPQTIILTGNHEQLMLDALIFNGKVYGSYDLWYQQGGKQTCESYYPKTLSRYERAVSNPKDHIPPEHFDWLIERPFYYEIDKYFFVHAGIPNHTSLKEFKEAIDNNDLDMKQSSIWIRDEFLQSVKDWGKKIIFGHTVYPYRSYLGTDPNTMKTTNERGYPFIMENKIGIDAMYHNDGNLIALKLPEEKYFLQPAIVDKAEQML